MKILWISWSPREKNTVYMIKTIIEATGLDYEIINLKDFKIASCLACWGCHKTKKCLINDDMQKLYGKMLESDYIVLGSPTYFENVTWIMKTFMDRCLPFYLSDELKGKWVALVSVGNYKGGEELKGNQNINKSDEIYSVKKCINTMESFCNHLGLEIIWNVCAISSNPQEKEKELKDLGRNLIK
ncbi:MAG: NADPH-dependent FMN reductase [uncultured bacterium (gcode 4)]|uniref:NADPH-dependent FMN reductase n=1 Tax=uncultured bacterium (gcode 4) TaxID=1234023 RepID=K2F628_9BACT|nr:MAG: NADPH-dependent FMN reductase [uncultured bacterium (gcode 4)]